MGQSIISNWGAGADRIRGSTRFLQLARAFMGLPGDISSPVASTGHSRNTGGSQTDSGHAVFSP